MGAEAKRVASSLAPPSHSSFARFPVSKGAGRGWGSILGLFGATAALGSKLAALTATGLSSVASYIFTIKI